jgi:carboxypeptidase family protein/matrixin
MITIRGGARAARTRRTRSIGAGRRRMALVIFVVIGLLVADVGDAFAYLKFGVHAGSQVIELKWNRLPARYFVNDGGTSGVTANDFQAAVTRAFSTWQALPSARVAYQFAGFTAAQPGQDDGISTLGFLPAPELEHVLASTSFLVDEVTGELLESDIFFNSTFPWSVASSGEMGRFDIESIALHEIGHFSGLGHSMIGETELRNSGRSVIASEAVMFPIAFGSGNTSARAPRADDVAGMSDLYPEEGFSGDTGSISGRVTKNGAGVFGAHVVAFNPATGALVANFSLDSRGRFSIAGLSPGPHVVRVEPLDDADIDSFFDLDAGTDVNFRVTYFDRLVVVPRGGDSGEIEIKVQPK